MIMRRAGPAYAREPEICHLGNRTDMKTVLFYERVKKKTRQEQQENDNLYRLTRFSFLHRCAVFDASNQPLCHWLQVCCGTLFLRFTAVWVQDSNRQSQFFRSLGLGP